MKHKAYFFIAGVMAFLFVSCSKDSNTVSVREEGVVEEGVATLDATDVMGISANLNGVLSNNYDTSMEKDYGFLYSEYKSGLEGEIKYFIEQASNINRPAPTFTKSSWNISEDNSFSAKLEYLQINTTYYYVAGVLLYDIPTSKRNVYFGEIKSFTTKDWQQITSSAENVAKYTATLHSECEMPAGQGWYQLSFFYSDTYSTLEELISKGTEVRADSPTFKTSFSSDLAGLKPNTKYYYVPRAIRWGEAFYGEVKSFTTDFSNYPAIELVDLGLSVNWRGWNVGANNPVEYGDHYAWGETRYGNPRFNWAMYEFGGNMYTAPEKYNPSDKKTVLEPGDDVANVRLGGKWRMPTEAEWTELITNCTCVWIDNYDGVRINGLFFTAENGNSIFLPAAGHGYQYGRLNAGTEGKYWSSSLDSTGVADWAPVGCNAWHVQFDAQNTAKLSSVSRCSGFSVRPVCEK